jgi:ATP-binding cassette, subfamily B, bacterial
MTYFVRRMLLVYLPRYWRPCLLMFLCILSMVAFDTLFPLGTKFLIDLAIVPQDSRMLIVLIIGLAILYLLSSLGSMGFDYLIARVAARLLNDLRLKMFTQLQSLPAGYYTHLQTGDIITRFNTDLNAIEYALTYSVFPGLQFILQLILSIVVLFNLDVQLAVITVIILPLVAFLPKRLADKATQLTSQRRLEESALNNTVQENLQAHAVTRMFGLRDQSISAFSRQLDKFARIATRSSFMGWMVNRATNMGQFLIQLLVIAIGAYLVFHGRMSIGSLVGFTTLLISMSYAVACVSVAFAGLIPAVPSLERIESLLAEKVPLNDNSGAVLPRFSKQIRFDQVKFSYAGPDGKPNLDCVDFSIPCGQSVAFVGRSGSGKSTILNLLMRAYDSQAGRILLDDQNIQAVSLNSLRSQIGVVFQDTFLFNTSLRENIRLGRLGATDADVQAAAQAAGVHETIMGLPAGYATQAGEQGKSLSGGQRQRIALARAILRRPAILLLDEATSALDPEAETLIYDTLKKLRHTCTILSVTHRLAPIADMDQIIVLDQGQVVEAGSHPLLMNRKGLYYHLYTQQSGFHISSDGQYAEVTPARLRSLPLFEKLSDATLQQFTTQFTTERFEPGRTVIHEGEPGEKFYIIVRGKVSISISGPDRQPIQINVLQDGDYFGEIALLEDIQRTATVCALLPSLILTLDRQHFSNMVASHPDVRIAVEQAARDRRLGLTQRKNA